MSSMSWAGRVAVGMFGAAALATSSQAATYVFNVHVTQGPTNILSPTFTPVDFVQTWILDPIPQSQAFSAGGLTVHTEFAQALATWSPTPFDGRLQSLTGLALPEADFSALKYRNGAVGSAPVDGYQIRLAASASDTLDLGVLRFEKDRSIGMTAVGGPHNNFDLLDAFGVRDLLLYAGPLQWKEEGRSQTFLNGALVTGFADHLAYSGVATLIGFEPTPPIPPPSAVPEPATWALLLSGFGLMGAYLRRRRAEAAASAASPRSQASKATILGLWRREAG